MRDIDFDPEKDRTNITKHRISLERAADFEVVSFRTDDRFDYGEVRYRAWGYIDGELHCLVFTERGEVLRAISLRRARIKEMKANAPKDK